MKSIKSILMTLGIPILTLGLLTLMLDAAPPGKGPSGGFRVGPHKSAQTVGEISSLKKGQQYAMVCTQCKGLTIKTVDDAKTLCHDGGTPHCDSCKRKVKIKRVGPAGKKHIASTKVTYVNDDGTECMFLVPMGTSATPTGDKSKKEK